MVINKQKLLTSSEFEHVYEIIDDDRFAYKLRKILERFNIGLLYFSCICRSFRRNVEFESKHVLSAVKLMEYVISNC